MSMSGVDSVILKNIYNLLEANGLSEHQCIVQCGLNSSYFSNMRKGVTKHVRVCDMVKFTEFFGITPNDICTVKRKTGNDFLPEYTLLCRDEKIMMKSFKKLDAVSRINVAEFINKEIEASKERMRERQLMT